MKPPHFGSIIASVVGQGLYLTRVLGQSVDGIPSATSRKVWTLRVLDQAVHAKTARVGDKQPHHGFGDRCLQGNGSKSAWISGTLVGFGKQNAQPFLHSKVLRSFGSRGGASFQEEGQDLLPELAKPALERYVVEHSSWWGCVAVRE